MKDTVEVMVARSRAGYRPPEKVQYCCKNCGAVGYSPNAFRKCYFCKRHQFYVHSLGLCPSFSADPYVPKPASKPPFVQEEMFK